MENIIDKIVIPAAFQLSLDDVGWHDGNDLREIGQPSRSGLPRYHHPLDYRMLAELGKAIDMKIVCPLCLCDWDKDNYLRGHVGITHKPYTWDRASEIDLEYTRECFEELESAEYIEYAIHGLAHGRYTEKGELIWEKEYFPPVDQTKQATYLDPDDFQNRLDLFFKIYDSWGFSQKIRAFVAPCGMGKTNLDMMNEMAEMLEPLGVKYWTNGTLPYNGILKTFGGIASIREVSGGVPWNAYDFDPKHLKVFDNDERPINSGIFGIHWTNLLRYNPENNLERLDAWVEFFHRQSEVFGTILSKDIAFAANQLYYKVFAKLDACENKCVIDLGDAIAENNVKGNKVFYISFKNGLVPTSIEGGEIKLYETHNEFSTYEIKHTDDKVVITF